MRWFLSVVSVGLAASAVINAWLGNPDFVLATGTTSIAMAILAVGERNST
jgi:hypothetical protein